MTEERSLVRNAGDVQQIRKAEQKSRLRIKEELADIRALIESPVGRRFFWRYLGICGINQESFVPGAPDSTAFNEGKRNIGNRLLSDIMEAKAEAYIQMMQEAKKKEETDG